MSVIAIAVGGKYPTAEGGFQARERAGEMIHAAIMEKFPFSYYLHSLFSKDDPTLFGFIVGPLGGDISADTEAKLRKTVEDCMVSCGFSLVAISP